MSAQDIRSDALPERESMEFDVVVVGAGPAGLSTAIRLKQLDASLSVVVVEKGSEVGAHILSGAVIDPIGLDRLLPDWRQDQERPLRQPVARDQFYLLGHSGQIKLPNALMPPLMDNHGCFVGSLGKVARWLGRRAEALGVEIYPGFAATELLLGPNGEVVGIATGDMGIGKDGRPRDTFTRGMELRARYTVLAEGARGSLSKQAIARFGLDAGRSPQKYGIGLKELWEVSPEKRRPGLVQHTFGWPLDNGTGGGSFLYHLEDGLVSVGFVVHLDYSNPNLSPFEEFQRLKTHPLIAETLATGRRLSYGARALTEGGWQSTPKLVFPGGLLVGCAAGFMNVPRIKGSHNAILSGIQAADELAAALAAGRAGDELSSYEEGWRTGPIGRDLKLVRNVKPLWSRLGTLAGVPAAALDMWTNSLLGFSFFGTLAHRKADHEALSPLTKARPLSYPKADGKLTFDRLSSVFVSNTNHEEDQPSHLRLRDPSVPISVNLPKWGEPARLYCPAGVYEVVYADDKAKIDPKFLVNAQNCVHCKTCDIKDPSQNIDWTPPEGGGGPNYAEM